MICAATTTQGVEKRTVGPEVNSTRIEPLGAAAEEGCSPTTLAPQARTGASDQPPSAFSCAEMMPASVAQEKERPPSGAVKRIDWRVAAETLRPMTVSDQ